MACYANTDVMFSDFYLVRESYIEVIMFCETMNFKTTGEFIEHIKLKSEIMGIMEYGSRKCNDMTLGGDYDISIIHQTRPSENFNGIHFRIGGIPVDCMILAIGEFETEQPSSSMLLAHLDSTILFDRNGKVSEALRHCSQVWKAIRDIEDWEIAFYRFFFKHTLDKIGNRLFEDPLFSSYSISLAATIIIEAFERLNHLGPGKPRNVFKNIREGNPSLYEEISKLFSPGQLRDQLAWLKNAAEYVLADYGGCWKDEEQLFHLKYGGKRDEAEQKGYIDYLFK